MKRMLALLALLVSAALLFAQDKAEPKPAEPKQTSETKAAAKNPVTDTVRDILPRQQKNIIAAVEEMPADKFGYSPTPAQMTFGHLVVHMAMSNIELCGEAGKMPAPPMRPAPETDKQRLLTNLTKSILRSGLEQTGRFKTRRFDRVIWRKARNRGIRPFRSNQRLGGSLQHCRYVSSLERPAAAHGAATEIATRRC